MKWFPYIFVILMSAHGYSEVLYKCDFTANEKGRKAEPWTKGVYLSESRSVNVEFGDRTVIEARVEANGDVVGYVNGQYNFVLKGNVNSGGIFESAKDKGTFKCFESKNYPVGFVFKPWNVIHVSENEHTITTLNLLNLSNHCYFGKPEDAVKEIRARFTLTPDQIRSDAYENVNVTVMEKRCLDWGWENDSSVCLEWDIYRPYTHKLANCDDQTSYP